MFSLTALIGKREETDHTYRMHELEVRKTEAANRTREIEMDAKKAEREAFIKEREMQIEAQKAENDARRIACEEKRLAMMHSGRIPQPGAEVPKQYNYNSFERR